jgi:hypothetical protein
MDEPTQNILSCSTVLRLVRTWSRTQWCQTDSAPARYGWGWELTPLAFCCRKAFSYGYGEAAIVLAAKKRQKMYFIVEFIPVGVSGSTLEVTASGPTTMIGQRPAIPGNDVRNEAGVRRYPPTYHQKFPLLARGLPYMLLWIPALACSGTPGLVERTRDASRLSPLSRPCDQPSLPKLVMALSASNMGRLYLSL